MRERLSVYAEQTQPLIAYYRGQDGIRYIEIDGLGEVSAIQDTIAQNLEK